MKLFLVSRLDSIGWDEFDSFVVAAENEKSALEFHPTGDKKGGYGWTMRKEDIGIECIGESNSKVEEVIIASFNAG